MIFRIYEIAMNVENFKQHDHDPRSFYQSPSQVDEDALVKWWPANEQLRGKRTDAKINVHEVIKVVSDSIMEKLS